MPQIHPLASVHPEAELADDVTVGPFAVNGLPDPVVTIEALWEPLDAAPTTACGGRADSKAGRREGMLRL